MGMEMGMRMGSSRESRKSDSSGVKESINQYWSRHQAFVLLSQLLSEEQPSL